MKPATSLVFLFAFVICLTAAAQDSSGPVAIFDGKTLDGWDYDPAIWRVEDGLITGGSTTDKIKENFFIATKKSYQNFELKLTIKCSGDPATGLINSGIQIRSVRVPGGNHMAGYQVDYGDGWFGKIYDEYRRRAVIAEQVDKVALDKAVDVFAWNEYRIRAEGPRVRVWINGVLATDYTEENLNVAFDGQIAPQVHSGGVALVQVKDVTIEELPPTPDAPTWESLGGVEAALKKAPRIPKQPKPKQNPKPMPKGSAKAPAQDTIPPLPKGGDRVNFDFESGDLQGWYVTEGWVGHPVANNKSVRNGGNLMNKEGQYYLGTLEFSAGGAPTDLQTGILESPVFQLSGPKIQFAVSGGSHDDTYVALYTLDGKEVLKTSAHNSEVFSSKSWDVSELVGKPVFVRLVDQHQSGWGHIVLDAFTAQGKLLPDETKKRQALANPQKPKSRPKAAPAKVRKKVQSERVEAWTPEQELAGFTVPEGFVIELVASEKNGIINPIDVSFDDSGRLWTQTGQMYPLDPISGMVWKEFLALMEDKETQNTNPEFKRIKDLYQLKTKGDDKILILDDPTQAADGPLHVWADGLSIPQSILPYKDGAYVCHGAELFLLRDTDGDGTSDKMEPVLSGFGFTDTHTMSHLLVRGPGSYIHFSQGALNKALVTAVASGKQHRVDASCQVRFQLDHQDFEVVSSGPSNMWGLQLRANGQWYGTEANDRAYSVIPWEHGTGVTGAAYHPLRPYQPLLPELHKFRVGGTGISGLEFSEDTEGSFPVEEWKDVALLANCITSTINAVRIDRNSDGTVESEHLPDFLSSTDDWFRPVNIEFGPDGCLYVADFYNKIIAHNEVTTDHPDRDKAHGRIWRIRHESQKHREIPNVTKAGPDQLLVHLQSPTLWEKRAAWHQIGDRGLTELAPSLVKLAANEATDTVTRIHALWSLEELKHFDSNLIGGLLKSEDDDLRREAVRSLASFDIEPAGVASRLVGYTDDANCMVRSQAIRTLGDLKESAPAVIGLLIEACKPALLGNALGGSYERNFERFLARMALEKFPLELKRYLDQSSKNHPAANVLWAIQALDDEAKKETFLKIWSKVSGRPLDGETFVAITGMLTSPEVYAAVKPIFQDPSKAENLVSLTLANQSRVQSKALVEIMTPGVSQLLESPDTIALGLNAIGKLRIATLGDEVAAIQAKEGDVEMQRLLFAAMTVNPARNAGSFKEIAIDIEAPFDLRIEAAHALTPIDLEETYRLTKALIDSGDSTQTGQVASSFSQSKEGSALLCGFFKNQVITEDAFDLSSAERVIQANPGSPHAKAIIGAVRKRVAQQRKEAQTRIHDLMAYVAENPGDPEKGALTFSACLTCHRVGDTGQEIAPPLDGSGHRELEHLLTAIIDPDAAVEGGYGLYRITKTNGSVVEGLLEKEEPLGTTIAMMGGGRIFVPQAEIGKGSFVGGRSFMPAAFSQLPEETMADLVAYIATLKEGGTPQTAQAAPPAAPVGDPAAVPAHAAAKSANQPNIILIFTDDQGYEDLGCFGSTTIKTPNLDRMASEGLKLTNFYAQPVCGVSRAALMTGSYPIRVGEPNNVKQLHTVPHPKEVTMAEVLKSAGYATGIIGKWHLTNKGKGPGGFEPTTMPNAQGFDYFYGTPVFNGYTVFVEDTALRVPIFRNQEVVVKGVESWDNITGDYTKEAIDYIEQNQDQPFFLYLAHNMPHIPVGASENFKGKSEYGPYGDTIEEIDWSTGQILDKLKELGIDDNTLIVYTSDNGPWVETTKGMKPDGAAFIPRDHSGSAAPLRGWKMSAWDGGSKVPFIARWPKKIEANGVSDEILSTMDLLPTFAKLAGAELPADRTIDGHDATSFLLGKAEASPRDDYFYYSGCLLTGVRVDQWKLVLPRPGNPVGTGWWGRMIEEIKEVQLFDLDRDPGETTNLVEENPATVKKLMRRIESARAELGDMDVVGSGARFFDEEPRRIGGMPKKRVSNAAAGKQSKGLTKYDNHKPVGNLRFSFESGEMEGWELVEGDLSQPVTALPSLLSRPNEPFARHGGRHLSTLAFANGSVSDKQAGVLQSPTFTLEGDRVAFLAAGGYDEETLFVALVDADSDEILIQGGGARDHQMRRVIWDVSKWKGRAVRFKIVDQNAAGWGHLNVDDFSAQGTLVAAPEQAESDGSSKQESVDRKPNFVIIFTDDQGYGDLSCFGGDHVSTPRIDQMAAEGSRLTSFYVAAPVCTPSRAALMTGCYPKRVNMATGSNFGVLLAGDTKGLNPDEITIAEVLKRVGYKTGMFGKWHLGDQPEFLPTRQGFDEYFGIPFSHDIHPFHPRQDHFQFPPLALLEGDEVIEMDPDADFLTKRITEHAVDFIKRNKDEPFFLYVPHPIPHKPLHVSPPFMKGVASEITERLKSEGDSVDYKTRDKLFHQAIAEIDWSVGQILDTLKALGLDENTLVIFTSDNGPAIGSAGPLKGRKGSTNEGGMREPTVIRWPDSIPAGQVNDELMTTMDLLPTFAKLAGAEVPTDRIIDGKDIWPVLTGKAKTPHEAFFYHGGTSLKAVRSGEWKLHAKDGKPTELYDIQSDIGERTNVIKKNPTVVKRLSKYLADFAKDIAENNRPAAFIENPKPLSK